MLRLFGRGGLDGGKGTQYGFDEVIKWELTCRKDDLGEWTKCERAKGRTTTSRRAGKTVDIVEFLC